MSLWQPATKKDSNVRVRCRLQDPTQFHLSTTGKVVTKFANIPKAKLYFYNPQEIVLKSSGEHCDVLSLASAMLHCLLAIY